MKTLSLLKGHSVLKSSPVLGDSFRLVRYRITLDQNDRYTVHMEIREANGSTGEQFLYQGDSPATAEYVFERYCAEA